MAVSVVMYTTTHMWLNGLQLLHIIICIRCMYYCANLSISAESNHMCTYIQIDDVYIQYIQPAIR